MCTSPLKCYKLSKKLLQEYVEKKHLWSFDCIETITNLETDRQKAINYYTKKLWYEKEENHYKIKRINWKRKPSQYTNCYICSEINCGHCQECKFKRGGEWALRCELETMYHKENCFITLTYNNENLPDKRSLKMTDLQKFWKRLRRYIARQEKKKGYDGPINRKIKYFACGEYGPKTLRPHYHALIFGWKPDDLELRGQNFRGDKLYTSKKLATIWGKGYVIIGENASRNTAQYVAQYVTKKLHKELTVKHGREEEFVTMSRREGIGKKYLMDNFEKIWKDKGIWIATEEGGKLKNIPKYFNKQYQQYFEGLDHFGLNEYLMNPYDKRTLENTEKSLERKGEILRNTTKNWDQYLLDHAEKKRKELEIFTRENEELVEEREQFKVEIKDKRLPEEHYKNKKEMRLALKMKRLGQRKRAKTQLFKKIEYLAENDYTWNPYTHSFTKLPF